MPRRVRPTLAAVALGLAIALGACGGGAPDPATPVIAVEATEYEFSPAAIEVPAGRVTFRVHNAGTEEHEFEIFRGDQVVDEVEGLVPGLTKDLTLTLERGDYTFACKLNGHDLLGMSGTLSVTPG